MKIVDNQEILTHLIGQENLLRDLKEEFNDNEINEIINFCKDIRGYYPEVMDQFHDWINDAPIEKSVLSIR